MPKSEFELYHEKEILDIPTNGINTAPNAPTEKFLRVLNKFIYDKTQNTKSIALLNDIENAVGGQLDDIGDDFDLPRLGKPDDLYRFLLKLKMVNRTSQGTANEVIAIVAATFNVDPSEVQVHNDYKIGADGQPRGEPLHVNVENLPLDEIEHPEITQLFINELQNALALGITLSNVTFEVSSTGNLYVGTAAIPFNFVEVESDIGTETTEREVDTTTYLRSTQVVNTEYEIESEEVTHG
ncbi:hypothetical protein GPK34_02155 [Secundilactobacillus kimchicus]|uniref:hypothetical protein n=1 Tax=Secundilactobacillus kimchicus TaxID=528209 RepID=UPI001C00EFF3|nr:hypothetical protein [Secundilactobacillus kimchicus]MBT9670841.1 hypothetical protein [Secundilactobacillus kimchicus]